MRNMHYAYSTRFAALFMAVCMLLMFCACSSNGDTVDTTVTDAPATEAPVTEGDTPAPETEGEPETNAPAETEAETEAGLEIPEEAPDSNKVLSFFESPLNETIFSKKMTATEIVSDENGAPVLKLTTAGNGNFKDPCLKVDYAAYMDALGLEPINWNDCAYAVVTLKVENVTNTKLEITLTGQTGEKNFQMRGSTNYSKGSDQWQTVSVPLVESERENATLSEIRIDFVDKAEGEGETVYIRSVTLTSDKGELMSLMGYDMVKPIETTLRIPGLTNTYKFLQVTDLHASAFSDLETKSMSTDRVNLITARRNAFRGDLLLAEERMPYMFGYADEIGADMLLLSGDILDFPSQKNIALLKENIAAIETPSFYILGNHDWCYGDSDYFSQYAIQNQIPLFNEMSVGEPANDPYFHYVEYEDLIVAAVDNSMDSVTAETVDKFLALYEKNKPIILMLHVPLHVDTLVEDSIEVWKKDLGMGGDTGVCAWHPEVQRFYQAVAEDENSPVVAVFAGHVHFTHEDILPNGVPQYITSTAYTGDCRIIHVTGEEAE